MQTHTSHTEPKTTTAKPGGFFGKGEVVPFFQPKLTVNTPGDAHEQEADRVADQVMRMREGDAPIVQRMPLTPVGVQRKCAECEQEVQRKEDEQPEEQEAPVQRMASSGGAAAPTDEEEQVQRKCTNCEKEEKEQVQRQETGGGDAGGHAAPSIVSDVLSSGGGQPMESGTRQFMESRFGQDFSQVRIHTNSRAAESASSIQARAYTSGKDIVFGKGEYQPSTSEGQRLLAHELVHVGQQGNGYLNRMVQRLATIESPRREDIVFKSEKDTGDGQVQRTSALNQSTPTNHDPQIAYPWGPPAPGGYNYHIATDGGTPLDAWVALGAPADHRYWCHGHSLGTYARWSYSVYSGASDLGIVLREEYIIIPQRDVRQGDIAVWTPSFGHSCRFETVVKNNGIIDDQQTIMSTKNGKAPLQNMSLLNVKAAYAAIGLATTLTYYRKK